MQLLSCHDGKLIKVDSTGLAGGAPARGFVTGLAGVDRLLPGGTWARGAMHEILWDGGDDGPRPFFFAAWLARAASGPLSRERPPSPLAQDAPSLVGEGWGEGLTRSRVVWCDPRREVYPPAIAAVGIPLEQLFLLRPKTREDEVWAVAECLACAGVAVTIAQPPALSRVEARRLQLAAERGGGVGLLLRPRGAGSTHHAAATRWLVEPAAGDRTVQRWKIQLIYGHGGHLQTPVYLECSRDDRKATDRVRAVERLADRPREAERAGGAARSRRIG